MLNIYKASAGSGKTFRLTREYLQMLLGSYNHESGRWEMYPRPQAAHRHILAITFTNKATDEMTERIISQLALLGRRDHSGNRSPYLDYFCELFRKSPEEVEALASLTLDDLLMDYAYFHVSTIDAFFQIILRTFAREVEIDDDFDIHLDDKYVVRMAVADVIGSINFRTKADPVSQKAAKWVHDWLYEELSSQMAQGQSIDLFSAEGHIQSNLATQFNNIINEQFKLNFSVISESLADISRIQAFYKALVAPIENLRQCCRKLIENANFGLLNVNLRGKVLTWANDGITSKSMEYTSTIEKMIDGAQSPFPKANDKAGKADGLLMRQLDALFLAAAQVIPNYAKIESTRQAAKAAGIVSHLLHSINEITREANMIQLSDTGSILRRIISDDDTPFVYERLGYYLNHYLIDEFQDTSKMQWEILRPLVAESLSRGEHNLIIGDEKQCIYRFRNSDPALLGHQVADYADATFGEGTTSQTGSHISENTNWRSSVEVVKFNNSLFLALSRLMGLVNIYGGVIQRIDDKNLDFHGAVKLTLLPELKDNDSAEESEKTDGGDELSEDSDTADVLDRRVVDGIAEDVSRWLRQGYRQSDIAVLVRTHNEGAQIIRALLALNNNTGSGLPKIEISSSDTLRLADASSVKIIIEVLRLSLTPETQKQERVSAKTGESQSVEKINERWRRARLNRWHQYFINLDTDPRTSAPTTRSSAIADAVIMTANVESLSKTDLDWRMSMEQKFETPNFSEELLRRCSSLPALVETIIQRYIRSEVRANEVTYLTSFMDTIIDFTEQAGGGGDVKSFLSWWDRGGNKTNVTSLAETDAVKVMTIHQSKGLEFKCVAAPICNWKIIKWGDSYRWFDIDSRFFPWVDATLVPKMLPLKISRDLLEIDAYSDETSRLVQQCKVDLLNLAYVALTRASERLSVYVVNEHKSTDAYLTDYLESLFLSGDSPKAPADAEAAKWVIPLEKYFDAKAGVLTYGDFDSSNPEPKSAGEKDSAGSQAIFPYATSAYRPGTNSEHYVMAKEDIEPFDYDDPRQRGVFLHRILQRLSSSARLEIEVTRAAYRAHFSQEQRDELIRQLGQAIEQVKDRGWFDGYRRLLAERPIMSEGKILRPDRVVWTADGHIDVIDYKTGKEEQRYSDQVVGYAEALRRQGYGDVRGFIWYVLDGVVERVI